VPITTYKTWLIKQDIVNEDDILWLKGHNIQAIMPEWDVREIAYGNQTWKYTGPLIKNFGAITTTKKQEDMLVLKYGNTVQLNQVVAIDDFPPTVSIGYTTAQ
jgi:hypothetical protein